MDCTIYVAETKALISFVVTAKLIGVFVFAYAKSRFSHNEAHIVNSSLEYLRQLYINFHWNIFSPLWLYSPACVGQVGKPEDRFSHDVPH